MSDDLVERVALVICCTNGQCYRPEKCFSWTFSGEARAAIAVALEEAAKVAENSWYAPNVMYFSEEDERKAKCTAFEAAAAIRAMIPQESA